MTPWFGLHLPNYTFADTPPERLFERVVEQAKAAETAGFSLVSVMDHLYQIPGVGPVTDPMLEGWSTLAALARETKRVRLGTVVTGVTYRNPALLAKTATTLDVLSGGRAWLGIGAAWNQEESQALGFPFPPLGERFEMLEETLRIAHEMWQGERGSEAAFNGRQFQAMHLLNSPQSISRPRPPIMVGGGGEKKTLRLVAQYADACNVFGSPEGIARKYAILDQHCADVGRDPREIERSTLQNVRLGPPSSARTESPQQIIDRFGELWDAGAEHIIFELKDAHEAAYMETLGRDVVPALQALG